MANKNDKSKTYFLKNDVAKINVTDKKSRWAYTFGVTSGNFSKLVLGNIILLVLLLPIIFMYLQRNTEVAMFGTKYPFSQNLFTGYPVYPQIKGIKQSAYIYANRYLYLGYAMFSVLGAILFSGVFYFMRNLLWTNGSLRYKDFFKGIKLNFLNLLVLSVIYALILSLCTYIISICNYYNAVSAHWYFTLAKISSFVMLAVFGVMYVYAGVFSVNYKVNPFKAIVVAFKFTFTFIIQNAVMFFLAFVPFLLFATVKDGIGNMIFLMIIMIVGVVYFALFVTSYCMFVFEKVVKSKPLYSEKEIKTENKKQKSEKKPAAVKEQKKDFSMKDVKPIDDEDVEIYELPESFSRADLEKLEKSKQNMREDSDAYASDKENNK